MAGPDDQANGTGRANPGDWSTLSRRVVHRDDLASVDATVNGISEVIDLRRSRIGYHNALYLFVQLLGGATSVTLELYESVMDPLPASTPAIAPADDDTDWALVDTSGAITANKVVRFPTGSADLSAGLYKVKVAAITAGGGKVRVSEAHTLG